MRDSDAPRYRELLERLRDELRQSLEGQKADASPVSPDRAIGRLTRQEAIQSQQMALEIRRRNQIRLEQVERALRRLDNGTYGICARCEEEISESRLNSRPEAHLCVRCAT